MPWSDSGVRKPDIEYLIDIFTDLPTALFGQQDILTSAHCGSKHSPHQRITIDEGEVRLIIQRLQYWKSAMLQRPGKSLFDSRADLDSNEHLPRGLPYYYLDYATPFALYAAVCTITLNAGFSDTLQTSHRERCTGQAASSSETSTTFQWDTDESQHHNILQWYHSLLVDACSLARYYMSCKGMVPQPSDILVSLRQVWMTTRHLNCTLAMQLGSVMAQIMDDSEAGLPLFLYT